MNSSVFALEAIEARLSVAMPAVDRVMARPAPAGGVRYLLFVPRKPNLRAPPIVVVHGISRNAAEYMEAFAPIAERTGTVLIAPVFDEHVCRKYQKVRAAGQRADRMLLNVLKEVAGETGVACGRIGMFGFSGGAQFAHRFAMLHPGRVVRLVLSSAGWYTFPTASEAYPYGIASRAGGIGRFGKRLDRFLAIPTLVMVGEFDTTRDSRLRKERAVDSRQGRTRVERAARWTAAIRDACEMRGMTATVAFRCLPGCGHEFVECVSKGALARHAMQWLLTR